MTMFLFLQHAADHKMTEFVSHKICWLLREDIIFTHAFGDFMFWLSYWLIPVALLIVSWKYKFNSWIKYLFYGFALFIFLCGSTHALDYMFIWSISENWLIFDGWLRVAGGLVSFFVLIAVIVLSIFGFKNYVEFMELTREMQLNREKFGRVSDELWEEFERSRNTLDGYLRRADKPEQLHITN